MKKVDKVKGISLIVLIVTIIIILILVMAIILAFSKNNPIAESREAVFKHDVASLRDELDMYILKKKTETLNEYDENELFATNGNKSDNKWSDIYDVIPSIEGTKYEHLFDVVNGKLVYKGTSEEEEEMVKDLGILKMKDMMFDVTEIQSLIKEFSAKVEVIYTNNISESDVSNIFVKLGEESQNYTYTATLSVENCFLKTFIIDNLEDAKQYYFKIVYKLNDGRTYETDEYVANTIDLNDPNLVIPAPSVPVITSSDTVSNLWQKNSANLIIKDTTTDRLVNVTLSYSINGTSPIEITSGATLPIHDEGESRVVAIATNQKGVSVKSKEFIVRIDKTAPSKPTVTNKTGWSNSSINLTLSSDDSDVEKIKYKVNDDEWKEVNVNATISITEPGTIYVVAVDKAGNESEQIEYNITIDKEVPSAGTINCSKTTNSISATVTGASDDDSKIKEYEFYKNGSYVGSSEDGTYTFEKLAQETKYVIGYVVVDNAGNKSDMQTIDVTTDAIPSGSNITYTITPTKDEGWTNQSVTVNITYNNPSGLTGKYSYTNSTNLNDWKTDTKIVLTENKKIYLKYFDSTDQSSKEVQTIEIDYIDRKAPNDAVITNVLTDVVRNEYTRANVTLSDDLSDINVSESKYLLDTSSAALGVESSKWSTAKSFTSKEEYIELQALSTATNWYIHVLSVDNAGNKIETVSSEKIVTKVLVSDGSYEAMGKVYSNSPTFDGYSMPKTYYVEYDADFNETIGNTINNQVPLNWYGYSDVTLETQSKWANIVVIENDSKAYLTWIPRYVYKIDKTNSNINIRFVDINNNYIDFRTGEKN